MPGTSPRPENQAEDPLVKRAKQDLAQRLNVLIEDIELMKYEEVVWPDASLGCPQPGMRYKQVPYDGALIILKVAGREYEYHNGGSRGLFLCEQTIKVKPTSPDLDEFLPTPGSEDN
jgi:hypothetical protein